MPQKEGWAARLQRRLQANVPFAGWRRFWFVAAFLLAGRLLAPGKGDTFQVWMNVGMTVFVLLLCAMVLLLDSPQGNPSKRMEQSTVAPSPQMSIDVWMPLAIVGAFLLLLMGTCLGSSRGRW